MYATFFSTELYMHIYATFQGIIAHPGTNQLNLDQFHSTVKESPNTLYTFETSFKEEISEISSARWKKQYVRFFNKENFLTPQKMQNLGLFVFFLQSGTIRLCIRSFYQ